jgi:hypothetical protein
VQTSNDSDISTEKQHAKPSNHKKKKKKKKCSHKKNLGSKNKKKQKTNKRGVHCEMNATRMKTPKTPRN